MGGQRCGLVVKFHRSGRGFVMVDRLGHNYFGRLSHRRSHGMGRGFGAGGRGSLVLQGCCHLLLKKLRRDLVERTGRNFGGNAQFLGLGKDFLAFDPSFFAKS